MRIEHQPVNTLLAFMLSVSGVGIGCSSEGTQTPGETTSPAQTSSATAGSTSTNGSSASAVTSTSAAPSTGATGTSGGTGGSGGTASSGTTGGGTASTSGAATSTSTAGQSTNATGPDGSDDETTSSGTGSNGTSAQTDGSSGSATSSGDADSSQSGDDETSTSEPEDLEGSCNASAATGRNAMGTGPHDVVVETNSDNGIRCGTIYRPADLGGEERYPIFVWGEGGCSQDGYSNATAMAEIASWGYFVVADGTPGGQGACAGGQSGEALLDYITWAIDENRKPCSAYYHSLEPTKIAADGFSCGGLMAENVAGDPRFTAIGITSSGLMGANNNLWDSMHAPFKIMNGGSSDVAYQNGLNDYEAISSRGIPILYFSKTSAGHGGDLGQGRGDFNLVNLAWLNWNLKGDEGATGKAFLIGPTCEFCNDGGWVFMSANIE